MRGEVRSQKLEVRIMGKPEIKKILIVAPNWIGDAVLAVPAISMIRENLPKALIGIIGLPHICELFKKSPYIDQIYPADQPSISPFNKWGLRRIWGLANNLRSEKFDMAILFPNSFRSALIVRLAGIPLRCGYAADGRRLLLNVPVSLDSKVKRLHQTKYYLNLVTSVGLNNNPPISLFNKGGLYISKDETQEALNTLKKNNIIPDDLIIGINPGAAYGSSKRWYPERFGDVARILNERYNAKLIVFGSQREVDIAEEIVRAADMPLLNMSGKTSIRELMALISQCRLFITNDSGPMHIAAELGVPVVAIFGSTDPLLTGPAGAGHIVIKKDVSCSPCFLRKCPKELECMDAVSVDNVLEGVEKILG